MQLWNCVVRAPEGNHLDCKFCRQFLSLSILSVLSTLSCLSVFLQKKYSGSLWARLQGLDKSSAAAAAAVSMRDVTLVNYYYLYAGKRWSISTQKAKRREVSRLFWGKRRESRGVKNKGQAKKERNLSRVFTRRWHKTANTPRRRRRRRRRTTTRGKRKKKTTRGAPRGTGRRGHGTSRHGTGERPANGPWAGKRDPWILFFCPTARSPLQVRLVNCCYPLGNCEFPSSDTLLTVVFY